ncbi:MAG: hypothetical protein R3C05_01300 [Pirellulaceae bacterium]
MTAILKSISTIQARRRQRRGRPLRSIDRQRTVDFGNVTFDFAGSEFSTGDTTLVPQYIIISNDGNDPDRSTSAPAQGAVVGTLNGTASNLLHCGDGNDVALIPIVMTPPSADLSLTMTSDSGFRHGSARTSR